MWKNDCFPKVYERVLVRKDCGEGTLHSFSVAYIDQDNTWQFADSCDKISDLGYRVTHWMPLSLEMFDI